jgi:hypothetical protein
MTPAGPGRWQTPLARKVFGQPSIEAATAEVSSAIDRARSPLASKAPQRESG